MGSLTEKCHPRRPRFTLPFDGITQETGQSLATLKRPVSPTLRDGQYQGRGIFGRMVDRISANLAWNKIVRPQHVSYGRISVDDLEAHTATFLESVRHRFDADIKSVNFAGRAEEDTSELQSLRHLVCRLLLEKESYRD